MTHRIADAALPILLSVTAPVLLSLIDAPVEMRAIFVVIAGECTLSRASGFISNTLRLTDQTAQALLHGYHGAAMFFSTPESMDFT